MNKYANLVNNGDRGTYEGTISQVLPKEVSVSPDGKYLERTLWDEKQWWNTTNGGFWEDSHIWDYDWTGKAGGSKWIADWYHNTPFYELSQEWRQAIQDGKDYNELPMKDLITLSKGALKDNFKPNDVLIKQAQWILEAYADNKIIQKMSLNDFYKLRKDDVAMAKMFADVSGNTMLIPRGFGEQWATYSKNWEVVTKKSPDGTFFIASATKEGSQFEPADKYVLGLKEWKVTLPTGETLEVVKNGTKKSVVLYPEKSTEPTLVFTDGKSEKLPNPV